MIGTRPLFEDDVRNILGKNFHDTVDAIQNASFDVLEALLVEEKRTKNRSSIVAKIEKTMYRPPIYHYREADENVRKMFDTSPFVTCVGTIARKKYKKDYPKDRLKIVEDVLESFGAAVRVAGCVHPLTTKSKEAAILRVLEEYKTPVLDAHRKKTMYDKLIEEGLVVDSPRNSRVNLLSVFRNHDVKGLAPKNKIPKTSAEFHKKKIKSTEKKKLKSARSYAITKTSKAKLDTIRDLSYRSIKHLIRGEIFETVRQQPSLTMMTLPGTDFALEQLIMLDSAYKSVDIVALEQDPRIYDAASKFVAPMLEIEHVANRMDYRNQSVTDYLDKNKGEKKFNAAWLDFMCKLGMDPFETIGKLLETSDDEITLITTFVGGRESGDVLADLKERAGKDAENLKTARTEYITDALSSTSESKGYLINKLEIKEYTEPEGDAHHVPMLHVQVNLVKAA